MQRRRRGGREAAVISTLTSVFGKALESSVESSWHPFGDRGGVGVRGGGVLRPRILLPAAVNIYACVLFIYIVKTNFAQGFNCFSLLCRNPSLDPTRLLLRLCCCLSATRMQKGKRKSVVCFQLKTFRAASRGPATNSVSVHWVTPSA